MKKFTRIITKKSTPKEALVLKKIAATFKKKNKKLNKKTQ